MLWVKKQGSATRVIQFLYCVNKHTLYSREYDGTWYDWKEFSTNIPAFYKDYSTFAALSSSIGNSIGTTTYNINGTTSGYRCIFKFPAQNDLQNYPMFRITLFASWADTILDDIVIGTNGSSVWGNVFHEENAQAVSYYYRLSGGEVYFYASPIGTSNYTLVVGKVTIQSNHTYTWVGQNLTELPSGSVQITTRV